MRCLLLCNSAYMALGQIQCSNIDELVLLEALDDLYECHIVERDSEQIKIDIQGTVETYDIVKTN